MAVNVIHDREHDTACLYCTTSNWAFGPVFAGRECEEQAECWLDWFRDGQAAIAAVASGIQPLLDANDPRSYREHDLERLYSAWSNICREQDGNLVYSHHFEDGVSSTDWAWRIHTEVPL